MDRGCELRAGVGVDPGLIGIGRDCAGVDVFADLQIDPEAGEKGGQNNREGLQRRDAQQVGHIMIAGGGGLCRGEVGGGHPELGEVVRMQGTLDDDGCLGRFGKLDDLVGVLRLGRREGQRPGEALQIMSVLDDVVAEAVFIEGAGGEFPVEGKVEDRLVERQVLLPSLGAEFGHGNKAQRARRTQRGVERSG